MGLSISPDNGNVISLLAGGRVMTWNMGNNKCEEILQCCIGHVYEISCDCKYIATVPWNSNTIEIWNMNTKGREATLTSVGCVFALSISRDSIYMASGTVIGVIEIWNMCSKTREVSWKGHQGRISYLSISRDNKYIISASYDRTIRKWEMITSQSGPSREVEPILEVLVGYGFETMSISSDNNFIVSSYGESIDIWDVRTDRRDGLLKGRQDIIDMIRVTSDGKYAILRVRDENTIKIWNNYTNRCEATLEGHKGGINKILISPDSKYVVSGSRDEIKVWNIDTKLCEATLEGHEGGIDKILISPDSKYVVSGSYGKIMIWNIDTKRCEGVFESDSLRGNNNFKLEGEVPYEHRKKYGLSDDIDHEYKGVIPYLSYSIKNIRCSNNMKYVFVGYGDEAIAVWDGNDKSLVFVARDYNYVYEAPVSVNHASNTSNMSRADYESEISTYGIEDYFHIEEITGANVVVGTLSGISHLFKSNV
jgi:WD40 repeat protein